MKSFLLFLLLIVSVGFSYLLTGLLDSRIAHEHSRIQHQTQSSSTEQENHSSHDRDSCSLLNLHINQPFHKRAVRIPHPLHVDNDTNAAPDSPSSNSRRYSHFRCFGEENSVEGFPERACSFENVCYKVDDRQIYFYRRKGLARPVLYDSVSGEKFDFIDGDHGFVNLNIWQSFGPHMQDGICPAASSPNTTLVLEKTHFLWSNWAVDDNLGHVLWEEIATIWYTMIRLDAYADDVVTMHGLNEDLPNRPLAVKFRDAFLRAIVSTEPVSIHPYIQDLVTQHFTNHGIRLEHICFDQLLAGGSMQRFLQRLFWHNYGHEPLLVGLRSRILKKFQIEDKPPREHSIVITNKTSSIFRGSKPGQTSFRGIYNLQEVEAHLKNRYPTVPVCVVDWSTLSIQDQLELLIKTTVLITPPGGISMLMPFLSAGAQAIIFDYLEKEDNWYVGSQKDRSVSMEAPFWNHWPHFKKRYYQVFSKDQLRVDDPNKSIDEANWRDETSVHVNLDRISVLVDASFEDMQP